MRINPAFKKSLSALLAITVMLSLLASFSLPTGAADTEDTPVLTNFASTATYKGSDKTNGTSNYGESDWNVYHSGKLNDGVIPADASDLTKGQNIEIHLDQYASGTTYVYFKLAGEVEITEIKAYANCRQTTTNRGYPTVFNVYVANSETDITADTLMGEATTSDTGLLRTYSLTGSKTGSYVIFELGIQDPYIVITFSEVELWGYGEIYVEPEKPTLPTPVLTSSAPKTETFTVPTISWEAVEGAIAYDVYLNGAIAVDNTEALSYTPAIEIRKDYTATDYYKVQVVAKSDDPDVDDSPMSEPAGIMYVATPTDRSGNPVPAADFIIDAGHGGSDSGALGANGRRESLDNLNMSFAVGERLEALGFTVAYTRINDEGQKDSVRTKAAKGEAGDYDYYLCFHRNSFSNELANGVEILYKSGDNIDKEFAQTVQDELVALGLFTDRGLKPRTDTTVLNNVSSIPVILLELGFISCPADNEKFDTYLGDIATAVTKGTIKYAGYKTDTQGVVSVNSVEYTAGGDVVPDVFVFNYGDNTTMSVSGDVVNGLGVTDLTCIVNGRVFDVDLEVTPTNDTEGYAVTDRATFNGTLDFTDMAPGSYTLKINGYHRFTDDALSGGAFDVLTVNLNIIGKPVITFVDHTGAVMATVEVTPGEEVTPPDTYREGYVFLGWDKLFASATTDMTVTASYGLLGDANNDGEVDSLDAAAVLKYDAGIVSALNVPVCDVNNDGEADSLDAAAILKLDAGIISKF